MIVSILGSGSLGKCVGELFPISTELNFFSKSTTEVWTNTEDNPRESEPIDWDNSRHTQIVENSDIIFICTVDDAIESSFLEVKKLNLKSTVWILHCSGSKKVFSHSEYETASIHFLQTFHKNSYLDEKPFDSCYATFVGSDKIEDFFKAILDQHDITLVRVSEDEKKELHLAAVFTCNFQHALFDIALEQTSLPDSTVLNMMKPLVDKTIQSIIKNKPIKTLSGPIKRNDKEVIASHIKQLSNSNTQKIYTELSNYLIGKIKNHE